MMPRAPIFVLLSGLAYSGSVHAQRWCEHLAPFELPRSTALQIVSQNLRVNGLETQIYRFISELSRAAVLQHFKMQFPQSKYKQAGTWHVISHRENDHLLTVQLTQGDEQAVWGFIACTNIFEVLDKGLPTPPAAPPMLPGTHLMQSLQANDQGTRSHTWLLLSENSPHQNLDFYRGYFQQQGYQPITRGALSRSGSGGAMTLNRNGEQLNVAVSQQGGQSLIAIVQISP